jgi:excinuclease UvrABC nuclease subunit
MIHSYKGHFIYFESEVQNLSPGIIGVYYCGAILENGNLKPYYIGKGAGEKGLRSRLLDHLRDDYWPDVTHFGFHECDTVSEAEQYELEEIDKYKPKYNIQK